MIKRSTPTSRFNLGFTAALLACSGAAAPAWAAEFTMLNDPSLSTGFEQRWNHPAVWSLTSGVDDGANGIPDGLDTFTIDRNVGGYPAANTDLSNEGMPTHSIAGITATGAPGRDIILKYTGDLTIGNLHVLPSASVFEIAEERTRDLTINGVISGSGDLLFSRSGSFSVAAPGDEIIITGASPNTFSGTMRFYNSSADTAGNADGGYWVADKVGAFGQASTLTIDGNPNCIVSQLILTTNTIGGEGAIDDDATVVYLGTKGEFNVAAGVNEVIGSGKLFVLGNQIGDGVYNNSESWITGDGSITVGVVPEPTSLALLGLGGLLIARRRRC